MQISPYETENLIFIDTEFSDLDPYTGEILSVGIVKLSGEELYLELEHEGACSKWVQKNVLPNLHQEKVSRADASDIIREFLGNTLPFAVAFIDNYDVVYLTKLLGAGQLPFRWVTIDFASILFAVGVNPVRISSDEKGILGYYKKIGVDITQYRQHYALDDARLLREAWMRIMRNT